MQKRKYWFIFKDNNLLLKKVDNKFTVPLSAMPPVKNTAAVHDAGIINKFESKTFFIENKPELPKGYELVDLRRSYDLIGDKLFWQAGKSFQIINWDIHSKYCPKCGIKTKPFAHNAKQCPDCKREFYPQISVAIMALVQKGDSILMIRGVNFRSNFYGLVAGFLEPGETLEECVKREVMEETNIKIKNIRYFASHPWPFPSNLMVGFFADYAGGKFKAEESEVLTGGFFNLKNLPPLPSKVALGRKMVDAWIKLQKDKKDDSSPS